jgi:Xaa-Pro dipeptidase
MSEHAAKLGRLRAFMAERGVPGLLLTDPASVAWLADATTGVIDRSAHHDPLAIAVTRDGIVGVTTNVEVDRLRSEHSLPFELLSAPWHAPDGIEAAARDALGPLVPGADHDDDLTALRLTLLPGEQDRLRALGRDATAIVEGAVGDWRPGDTDRSVQGAIAAGCEEAGIQPICVIVGGDERLERFRHPLAIGARMERQAMAVLVAMRGGLHVALTRYAPAGDLPASTGEARRIEAAVLAAMTLPGQTY